MSGQNNRLLRMQLAVWVVGLILLLSGSFHGSIWFDESYTLALVRKSFTDIWTIGGNDVHPVLYYEALHILYLVVGMNVTAFRLFSVAGILATALLGPAVVRRDWGAVSGLVFSAAVFFCPYYLFIGNQIRMYSWTVFAVAVCLLMALRIMRSGEGDAPRPRPWGTWLAFFVGSWSAASLHYYGALTAFLINLMLLAHLIRGRRLRDVAKLLVGAVCQIILYLPFLAVLLQQISGVSKGFWIEFEIPTSIFEILCFPFLGEAGVNAVEAAEDGSIALQWGLVVLAVAGAMIGAVAVIRHRPSGCRAVALWSSLGVYFGVILLGVLAYAAVDTVVLYYRYLSIPLVAVLLALALQLGSRIEAGALRAPVAIGALAAVAVVAQGAFCLSAYDPANRRVVEEIESTTGDGAGAVLYGDIVSAGAVSQSLSAPLPDQLFLDWPMGGWGLAYEAYQPELTLSSTAADTLARAGDAPVYVRAERGRKSVSDLEGLSGYQEFLSGSGLRVQSVQTIYRPYENRTYFVVRCGRAQ